MARILYVSQSYVPSRRADSIHVMHMCEGLARVGHEVELLTKRTPSRLEAGVVDDHAFYGIEPAFRVRKLPRPALRGGGLLFQAAIARLIRRRARQIDVAFCRFLEGAASAAGRGVPTIYEAHGMPRGRQRRTFAKLLSSPSLTRLVIITRGLRDDLARQFDLPDARTTIEPDAVRASFLESIDPPVAMPERPRAGYVGHLYEGRGVELIVELARRLPEIDFELVGGHDQAVAAWREKANAANVNFTGFVEPRALPAVYGRFDLLLMPYARVVGVQSGKSDTSRWMSPMKMFEYMATGRPIVASALPALQEILVDGESALLAAPESPDAWEAAVRRLVREPRLARDLGDAARRQVAERLTWDRRAERILDGLV